MWRVKELVFDVIFTQEPCTYTMHLVVRMFVHTYTLKQKQSKMSCTVSNRYYAIYVGMYVPMSFVGVNLWIFIVT